MGDDNFIVLKQKIIILFELKRYLGSLVKIGVKECITFFEYSILHIASKHFVKYLH